MNKKVQEARPKERRRQQSFSAPPCDPGFTGLQSSDVPCEATLSSGQGRVELEIVMMERIIPPGLERCTTCGEVSGTASEKYLARNSHPGASYDPEAQISALCRCHGPLCEGCGVNRIPRPISGRYYEGINMILHVPYFAAGAQCDSCTSRNRLKPSQVT